MAAKHTLHVALTEPLIQHVRHQIATGRYKNASHALREALLLLIERDKTKERGSKAEVEDRISWNG